MDWSHAQKSDESEILIEYSPCHVLSGGTIEFEPTSPVGASVKATAPPCGALFTFRAGLSHFFEKKTENALEPPKKVGRISKFYQRLLLTCAI